MNGMIQNNPGPCIDWYLPSRSTMARSHCCAMRGDWARMMPTIINGTIGKGLPIAMAFSTPTRTNPRNTNTEMMFPFTSGSFRTALEGRDHFFGCEPVVVSFGQDASGERFQPPCVLRRGTRFAAGGFHERPDATPGFEDAAPLELA